MRRTLNFISSLAASPEPSNPPPAPMEEVSLTGQYRAEERKRETPEITGILEEPPAPRPNRVAHLAEEGSNDRFSFAPNSGADYLQHKETIVSKQKHSTAN